jgi:hypothetical protein
MLVRVGEPDMPVAMMVDAIGQEVIVKILEDHQTTIVDV